MNVLLIDDEPMVRKIVRKMLERAGHHVVDVENGREGLVQLEQHACELILTDIIMPEVEGIEVLTTVKAKYPQSRVIAMSGGGRTGNIDFLEIASKFGASATLHKPFTYETLLSVIEQTTSG